MIDKTKKEFHYTSPEMVKDLIEMLPFREGDIVLDCGSGENKVWYKNIPEKCVRKECEIEDGVDFLKWDFPVDYCIGNPPFDIGWKFTEKATLIARKGIAFLGSIKFFNQFTGKRLEFMKEKGFELQHIHVVADARWFGKYFFLIFEKKKGFVSWTRKTY
jgi:hypothetical protein